MVSMNASVFICIFFCVLHTTSRRAMWKLRRVQYAFWAFTEKEERTLPCDARALQNKNISSVIITNFNAYVQVEFWSIEQG